jgi:adenine-specific DNA-methyltransferase
MSFSTSLSPSLFDDIVTDAPMTEGIKYAGSKLRLLPYILQLAKRVNPKTVLDGFSGTTRVAQAFAQLNCQVTINDISAWSKTFGTCYLLNTHPREYYQDLIAHLNALPRKDGWFTEHYGGDGDAASSAQSDGFKKPFQRHNTRKLDAVREEIERLSLCEEEKAVAITSLIRALDAVDSTIGHFASYLNEWSPRSYRNLKLEVPRLIPKEKPHQVYQGDIFDLLPQVAVDLAYFDPPYGSNNDKMPPSRVRYGAYYHLWTSICLFDNPELFGKVKRRADSSDKLASSVFEEFRKSSTGRYIAVEAIERLLANTEARFIILSYSSGGRATALELNEVIAKTGQVLEVVEVDYRSNVMGGMRWTNEWIRDAEKPNKEFLFLIEKK